MMKQANSQVQAGTVRQSTAGSFFRRMADSTQLLFRKKSSLQAEARVKIFDADSLIAKSDDYETAQQKYKRAIRLLKFALFMRKSKGERTHALLADAYCGLAVCRWADGQDDAAELKKAILHADWALQLNESNQNAQSAKKEAERRLRG